MTLAIGVHYPWSPFAELIRTGAPITQAVILVSDSRWTYESPSNSPLYYEDFGTKLFQLGKDCGAVYAGVSSIGEHCIEEPSYKLAKEKQRSFQRSLYLAEATFKKTYKYHKKDGVKGKVLPPLYFIAGVCDSYGKASLIYFSYSNNFKPILLIGVHGIGDNQAYSVFKEAFRQEVELKINDEVKTRLRYPLVNDLTIPVQVSAQEVGMILVAKLENLITTGQYSSIGGKVQSAIITQEGFQRFEVSKTTDITNQGPGWSRVTARPKEMVTLREKDKLPANYQSVADSFTIFPIYEK
jgi:hypothetical protein